MTSICDRHEKERPGESLAAAAGAEFGRTNCVRALPAQDIHLFPWPSSDSWVCPRHPHRLFETPFTLPCTNMGASASPRVYQPLARSDTIRLLRLEPGQFSDKIQGTLCHANLDENPVYIALSYVWGDAAVTAPIFCNGTEVSVTVSLANALARLRKSNASVVVWADALCIHQHDPTERSCQVGIMAKIYKTATQVVVFLGEDTEDTAMAFSVLGRVSSLLEHEQDPRRRREAFDLGYMRGENPGIPSAEDPGWTALRNLYRRDYFSRIWVVQEVALSARDPHVICGSHQTPWSRVMRVAAFCVESSPVLNSSAVKTHAPTAMYMGEVRDALVAAKNHWSLGLLYLLIRTRRSRATDRRDKLFALYGLANDISGSGGPLLKADYAMNVQDVLLHVMEFLVRRGETWPALSYAGLHAGRAENLPSWVPDWSSDSHGSNPLQSWRCTEGYNAAAGFSWQPALATNEKTMQVLGIPIGKVQSVFALSKHYITIIPELRQPGRLRSLWTDIVAPLGSRYPGGGTVADAFWRTLIANKDPSAQPAPAEFIRHFLAFWRLNRLADLAAEALGRTATSSVFIDIDYIAASKRVRGAMFSNSDQRAAYKRYHSRVLREQGSPCIGKSGAAHDAVCTNCAKVNDPMLFERKGFSPLREDDPSLAMMDDPFVAEWFSGLRTDQEEEHPMITADYDQYMKSFGWTVAGRSFIVTENGLMGLVPGTTQVGDVVAVIAGARTPFVLRSLTGDGEGRERFALVGEAYVHGVMGGEAVKLDGEGQAAWREMELE